MEAFKAGTAKSPIGPSALPLKLSPRNPLEMLLSRDCRSPALPCSPDMVDSVMEKPELPVGPDPNPVGGAGGGGAGDGVTEGLGDGFTPGLTFAMTGVLP
ncbi:hypothetical protein [Lentzea sp. NBRC 105346]|uniref:hypothetical protein n=1 Tax=Lentzea sp. NBRC 105346 TaxID=3032205 RepID=UPI0025574ADE|nr:hypothetical protein [Lentzea sp. NBRC 105346]